MRSVPIQATSDELSAEPYDAEVVNLFKGKMAEAVKNVPESFKLLSEAELHAQARPSANDWKLRQNFHDAVINAKKLGLDEIRASEIYEGVITKQNFYFAVLPNPIKIAWITRPVIEHTAFYNAIHREALMKLYQIVKDLPPDSKHLPQILKLAETAGNRVYGPVVQKMQIQSKNINMEVSSKDVQELPESQEEITQRIEALQSKLLEAPKDVTPKE